MNTKRTSALLVVLIITCLSFNSYTAEAAEGYTYHTPVLQPYIEYGRTTVNSHNSHAGYGIVYKSKWDVNISTTGQGNTKNGHQEPKVFYSLSRIFDSKVDFLSKDVKLRLGLAKTKGVNLIGDHNFKLGIILAGEVAELEIFHYSSGGVYKPNTGVDGVKLRINL